MSAHLCIVVIQDFKVSAHFLRLAKTCLALRPNSRWSCNAEFRGVSPLAKTCSGLPRLAWPRPPASDSLNPGLRGVSPLAQTCLDVPSPEPKQRIACHSTCPDLLSPGAISLKFVISHRRPLAWTCLDFLAQLPVA